MQNEQLQYYRQHGFVVVEDVFTLAETEQWKDEIRAALDEHRELLDLPSAQSVPDPECLLQQVLCLHHVHKINQCFRDLAGDARLTSHLASLIGPHVKCMQSQYFVKPPGYPGNPWHQDEGPIPTRDRSLVAAWIAVDASDEQNGCLRIIPGSHAAGYLYPRRQHHRPDIYDFPEESFGFNPQQAQAAPMRAGSVVFFSGYLLHGSTPNHSDSYRRAITFHYMNSYAQLPWRGGQTDYRDVLIVLGEDPYAWKGYENLSVAHLRRWQRVERRVEWVSTQAQARDKVADAIAVMRTDEDAALTLLGDALRLLGE